MRNCRQALTVDVGRGEHGNVAEGDQEPEEDEDADGGGEGRGDPEDHQAKRHEQQSLLPAEPETERIKSLIKKKIA